MNLIIEHRCGCGKAVLAPNSPEDRPMCWHSGKPRRMTPAHNVDHDGIHQVMVKRAGLAFNRHVKDAR